MKENTVIVTCPGCRTKLWIDKETGGILKCQYPVKAKTGFSDLISRHKKQEAGLTGALDKAFDEERKRKELMRKKFKMSMENIDEPEDDRDAEVIDEDK